MENVATTIREQAEMLAAENRKGDPSVLRVYWFPHPEEILLVETTEQIPAADNGALQPFYFRPSPADGLFAASGIALIRPEEFGKLTLPKGWGEWANAVEL